MSRDIVAIYADNPLTTLGNNDLLYVGAHPYNADDDGAILYSNLFNNLSSITFNAASGSNKINIPVAQNSGLDIIDSNYSYIRFNTTANAPLIRVGVESTVVGPLQTPYFSWNGGAVYNNTGALTASQSGTTVTGSGTVFPAACAHGYIYWPQTGDVSYIVSRDSDTQLTVTPSQTVASAKFKLFHSGSYFGFAGFQLQNGTAIEASDIDANLQNTTLNIGNTNATLINIGAPTLFNEGVSVEKDSASGIGLSVVNTAASGAGAYANFQLTTNDGAGDAYSSYSVLGSPSVFFTAGIDNTDEDYKISNANVLGSSNRMVINHTTGDVSFPVSISTPQLSLATNITEKVVTGNLNSAALNAMNTTAQQLVPAPGANLVNIVVSAFFNMKIGSTPWIASDFANIWLVYGTTANDQVNLASSYLTNQVGTMSASTNYVFGGSVGAFGADWLGTGNGQVVKVLTSNAANKAISITCVNPIVTAGNGNCDFMIRYITVPVS